MKVFALIVIFPVFLMTNRFPSCFPVSSADRDFPEPELKDSLGGTWVRMGPSGPVAIQLHESGLIEVDFGNDQSVDVSSVYRVHDDTLFVVDQSGEACPGEGTYRIRLNRYYLGLDLISDRCSGRVKMTMGYWTRPNFRDLLDQLSSRIKDQTSDEDVLSRARIHMAIGNSAQARNDLNRYLQKNPSDAVVYVNRAGTCFPDDFKGVIEDCNSALRLDPDNKNAYFLRGLALWELGEEEDGCRDFQKAIELGFTVLEEAESVRCADYWKTIDP